MFSTSVAVVLHIALREAVSRRHAYLTLEHLLYVLAHDAEGERILTAVGVDLARLRRDLGAYLDGSIEQMPRGQQPDEPEQTAAFRQVLQTAILHVQAAQRQEANAGDDDAETLHRWFVIGNERRFWQSQRARARRLKIYRLWGWAS